MEKRVSIHMNGGKQMPRKTVFDMKFKDVYPAIIAKAERKGRTKEEVYEVTSWLTGYTGADIDSCLASDDSYAAFFENAPSYHPNADLIKGWICGMRVQDIEDPLIKRMRQLDKLVDELAHGKTMDKIKR
jgi:hypothetical protein